MSKSEREQREAEKIARRARRLADRAEERARRKADNATKAAERAEELAQRAHRRKGPRDRALEDSIEDYVDEITEKWTLQAEDWVDEQSSKLFGKPAPRSGAPHSGAQHSGAQAHSFSQDDLDDEVVEGFEEGHRSASGRGSSSRHARTSARSNRNRRHDDINPRSRSSRRRKKVSTWKQSVRSKFISNRGFYRDKDQKKVCGVCAGFADYWNVETWQVRFAAVMGLIFIPSLTVPGYFFFYFIMDDKPYYRKASERYEDAHVRESLSGEKSKYRGGLQARKKRTKSDLTDAQAFSAARQKFVDIESRVRLIEAHVTSSKFELQREFKKISGEDA